MKILLLLLLSLNVSAIDDTTDYNFSVVDIAGGVKDGTEEGLAVYGCIILLTPKFCSIWAGISSYIESKQDARIANKGRKAEIRANTITDSVLESKGIQTKPDGIFTRFFHWLF